IDAGGAVDGPRRCPAGRGSVVPVVHVLEPRHQPGATHRPHPVDGPGAEGAAAGHGERPDVGDAEGAADGDGDHRHDRHPAPHREGPDAHLWLCGDLLLDPGPVVQDVRHPGNLRNTALGSSLAAAITHRSTGGAHTRSSPVSRPRTTHSATSSAVVAKGAGLSPAVMRVATNPGRTTTTRAPVPSSWYRRPSKKASMPALEDP